MGPSRLCRIPAARASGFCEAQKGRNMPICRENILVFIPSKGLPCLGECVFPGRSMPIGFVDSAMQPCGIRSRTVFCIEPSEHSLIEN